jgi:hypothetical protein
MIALLNVPFPYLLFLIRHLKLSVKNFFNLKTASKAVNKTQKDTIKGSNFS